MSRKSSQKGRRPTITVDFVAVVGLLDELRQWCQGGTNRTVTRSEVLRKLVRIAYQNKRFATILMEQFR